MATPDPTPVALSGDPRIDGLMEPSNWVSNGSLTLTWSPHNFGGGTWTAGELAMVKAAFDEWSKVANITFVRVAGGGDFKQATSDLPVVASGTNLQTLESAIGLAFTPDPNFTDFDLFGESYTASNYPRSQGDIFLDDAQSGSFSKNSTDFATILHEIGHALGLKHPHDTPRSFTQLGIREQSHVYWTVMSYSHPEAHPLLTDGWPVTPMPLDILAIQHIYGANMTYRTGNNTYNFLQSDPDNASTIWDAGGIDTIDARQLNSAVTLSLKQGAFNYYGGDTMVAIAYKVTIENAVGTRFDDSIIGNTANNTLNGLGGHDQIDADRGTDTLLGGAGNDTLNGMIGNDTLRGEGNEDTLIGDAGNDQLEGGIGNDSLNGGVGADTLLGGAGNDQLIGGAGNDVLSGDAGVDVLNGGIGSDIFRFSAAAGAADLDTIALFEGAGATVGDVIQLKSTVFAAIANGALSPDQFVSAAGGVTALDADDFILYDTSTGALYYDADGNGTGAAVQFAVISGSPDALDASDFVVI